LKLRVESDEKVSLSYSFLIVLQLLYGYFPLLSAIGFIRIEGCGLIGIQLPEKYEENFDVPSEGPDYLFPEKVYNTMQPFDITVYSSVVISFFFLFFF
jgi:hypothetical protein